MNTHYCRTFQSLWTCIFEVSGGEIHENWQVSIGHSPWLATTAGDQRSAASGRVTNKLLKTRPMKRTAVNFLAGTLEYYTLIILSPHWLKLMFSTRIMKSRAVNFLAWFYFYVFGKLWHLCYEKLTVTNKSKSKKSSGKTGLTLKR